MPRLRLVRKMALSTSRLALGKTIVDGGISWTYRRLIRRKPPPFDSVTELLAEPRPILGSNMGKPPAFDPVSEVEYLVYAV